MDNHEARTDYLPDAFGGSVPASKVRALLSQRAAEGWHAVGSLVSAESNRLYVVFERPLPAAGPEREIAAAANSGAVSDTSSSRTDGRETRLKPARQSPDA